ncbi:hypothetical protein BV25DRAFT_1767095, partial [Artomyces pyxidatus]
RIHNGALILQFLSKEAADWIKSNSDATQPFTRSIFPEGILKDRGYSVLVPFVPLTFQPDNMAALREIEERNRLPTGSVTRARWVKPLERRDPGQICGHAIMTTGSAEAANQIIRDGITVREKKVYPEKVKREPLRCLKCHRWGHRAADCHAITDTCGTCGQPHRTSHCSSYRTHYCVSCNSSDHSSWDRACPEFQKRCDQFNDRYPENNMRYFPTEEAWT